MNVVGGSNCESCLLLWAETDFWLMLLVTLRGEGGLDPQRCDLCYI